MKLYGLGVGVRAGHHLTQIEGHVFGCVVLHCVDGIETLHVECAVVRLNLVMGGEDPSEP